MRGQARRRSGAPTTAARRRRRRPRQAARGLRCGGRRTRCGRTAARRRARAALPGAGGVGAGQARRGRAPPTLRGEAATGVRVPTPGGGRDPCLTRRHFLYGALGVGALAAVGRRRGGRHPAPLQQDDSDELHVLEVPERRRDHLDELTEVDLSSAVSLVSSFELPYGTLVWANDDNRGGVPASPPNRPSRLPQVGLLFLGSGSHAVAVPQAVGQDEGFEIYDARACSTGLVWTEADILDGVWRVYSRQLRRGDRRRTPAHGGRHVGMARRPPLPPRRDSPSGRCFPAPTVRRRSEASLLKRAAFGTGESSVVYESHGRMSTPPYALADSVVITSAHRHLVHPHQLTPHRRAHGRRDGRHGAAHVP